MNYTIPIGAALLLLLGWFGYRYMNEPQPLNERSTSAVEQLQKGNLSQAMNELAPQTRGENLLNEVKTGVGITPTAPY